MTGTQGYVAISRRPLDLEDYIDVARRHVTWIAAPVFAGIVISIVVALMLPNTYISKAVMQITPARVSQQLVPTTVNQQLAERITQMQANILSRTSLSTLIQSPDLLLYPKERASRPLEDVIEAMKMKDLRISIDGTNLINKQGSSFTISFAYQNRFKAQLTVQKLMTRFMDENQNAQRDNQTLLKEFFGDELNGAKANLEKANEDLAKFRAENAGRLPEQASLNMTGLASVQAQVSRAQDELNRIAQSKLGIEQHISTLKGQRDLYSAMEKEVPDTMGGSPAIRKNEELVMLNKQIEQGETQVAMLLQSFRETYPEVRGMRKRLEVLKRDRDEKALKYEQELLEEEKKPKAAVPRKTTNYVAAKAQSDMEGQINASLTQLKVLAIQDDQRHAELEKLNKEMEDYRTKLAQTSLLEAKYADLKLAAQSASDKYQEMMKKSEMTAQGSDLISRKAGESLDVLDPPSLPQIPDRPNRPLIVGAGTSIAFMLGLALAGLQEAKDTSLKNLKDVRAYTNLPVLCSIPLLENTMLVKRKKRIAYLAWSAAVIVGIIAVSAAAFYYSSVTMAG
ncbi:MAG: lipopolysaccharide biosynthesis [Bryobacterales bacterium]|nr:lipopolysaccharide biosynthesis [Bryobacterales bacterium]